VEAAHQAGLVDHAAALVLLPVKAGRAEVAVEEAGGQQGRGEHLGVVHLAVGVGLAAQGLEKVVDKAVYCYGLF
jgi:hypothetical protein